MVDPVTIAAITASLGSVTQISRELMTLVGKKGDQAASEKIMELTQRVIEAHGFVTAMQSDHAALSAQVRELEQELEELKDFRREKEKYELQSLGGKGFIYAYKSSIHSDQTPHWLCATCFDRDKKSFMQFSGTNIINHGCNNWKCHVCNTELVVGVNLRPM